MTKIVEYKDPKDLRDIPIERLRYEGQRLAHQFQAWNDFFNIEAAMRISTGKGRQSGYGNFSELERWSILSNRYLLMEREHLSEFKLFTKEEVLKMIREAWVDGWQERRYSDDENIKQWEAEKEYMERKKNI